MELQNNASSVYHDWGILKISWRQNSESNIIILWLDVLEL